MTQQKEGERLPSYVESVYSESIHKSEALWRLCVQYEQSQVTSPLGSCCYPSFRNCIYFYSEGFPKLTSIRRVEKRVDKLFENFDMDNTLTIIIEGDDLGVLQDFEKLYTCREYWDNLCYNRPEIHLTHSFVFETIKYAAENKAGSLGLIASTANVYYCKLFTCFGIIGPPVTDISCTLKVRFRNDTSAANPSYSEGKQKYIFYPQPCLATLSYKGEIKESHKFGKSKGPYTELVFQGNDLNILKDMCNRYMNINLPSENYRSNCFQIVIDQCLVVRVLHVSENEIITCNLGTVLCKNIPHVSFYTRK